MNQNHNSRSAHKYKRIRFSSGHIIFRCMIEGCPHFLRKELLLNRLAICWICNQEFRITNLELAKQHCSNCTKSKRIRKFSDRTIDTLLNVIGG